MEMQASRSFGGKKNEKERGEHTDQLAEPVLRLGSYFLRDDLSFVQRSAAARWSICTERR